MDNSVEITMRNRKASEYINRKRKERKWKLVKNVGWAFLGLTVLSLLMKLAH